MSAHAELPAWRPDPRSPVVIDERFELLDSIGEGSTSIVYKARDRVNQQVVALKVLKGTAAMHPRLLAGFRREAEVGQRIVHPNVVAIYHSGIYQGWLYIAMEYISGRTLADHLAMSGRLGWRGFQEVFVQLLSALGCIHANGIVHRDIKPANMIMTRDGVWKLMDFGISREAGSQATAGPSLGTPEYMAPEQLLGQAATQASDIYAAGVVFFEALAGKRPFQKWQPVERCKNAPPRVRGLRQDVPQWLDDLIARALQPRSEDRPPDTAAMLSAAGSFEGAVAAEVAPEPEPIHDAAPAFPPESIPLATLILEGPAELASVLGLLAEALRRLQYIASTGVNHEPLTPHTLRLLPSGRIEISPHGPRGTATRRWSLTPSTRLRNCCADVRRRPCSPTCTRRGLWSMSTFWARRCFARSFRAWTNAAQDSAGWSGTATRRDGLARREIVPGTPPALSQMLERMTEKDHAKRFATYEEALLVVSGLANRTQVTQQVRLPARESRTLGSRLPASYGGSQIAVIAGLIFLGLIGMAALAARLLR